MNTRPLFLQHIPLRAALLLLGMASGVGAFAAVTVDSVQSGLGSGGSGDHTLVSGFVPGSSDKLVVVLGGEHATGGSVDGDFHSVTLNSVALTEAVQVNSTQPTVAIFYLDDPGTAAGVGDLVVNQANHQQSMYAIYLLSGTEPGVGDTASSTNQSVEVSTTGVSLVIVGYDNAGTGGADSAGDVDAVLPLTEDTAYLSVAGGENSFASGQVSLTTPTTATYAWTIDDPADITASVAAVFAAAPTRSYAQQPSSTANTLLRYRSLVGAETGGGAHPYSGPSVEPFADLSNEELRYADLRQANLEGVDLISADLTGADLSDADLGSATLWFTDLAETHLQDADLSTADLLLVESGGITGTPTALPTDWALVQGYLVGPEAELSGADLSGADLSGLNLSRAELGGADLSGADLTGTDLFSAILTGADLTDATLTNADLSFAEADNADLTRATLTDADLDNTELTGATLTGVISGGVLNTPATLPTDWNLIGGYVVGPEANLSGADLTGLNFTGQNLSNANLGAANFTGTTLTGADLTNAVLTGATGSPLLDRIHAQAAQLANEFTLSEIMDLRPGSVMIEVVGGNAVIQFRLQQSGNLIDWTDTGDTPEVTVPAPGPDIEYYRFAR